MTESKKSQSPLDLRPFDPNEWLTPDYITRDLQVPMNTWYQWRTAGKAPKAIKVGKHVRVRRRDYEAWLATLTDMSS